jgi:hypothetical protein
MVGGQERGSNGGGGVKWIRCGLTESGPIEIQFLRVSREFTVDKRKRGMKIVKKSDGDGENGRLVHTRTSPTNWYSLPVSLKR